MMIAVVYRAPAMTAEQYKASWNDSGGPPTDVPAGLVFHVGVGEGDDFFTISVWESQEAYDEFAPLFKQATTAMGFSFGEPAVLPVHHHLGPSGH